jgi:hypothetical protein
MRGSVEEASKNDPFGGAEFRCGAAKALDYISFHDKPVRDLQGRRRQCDSRLKSGRRGAVYLNKRREKRGCPTQWRFRNVLSYAHDTRWTATPRRVRISLKRVGVEKRLD